MKQPNPVRCANLVSRRIRQSHMQTRIMYGRTKTSPKNSIPTKKQKAACYRSSDASKLKTKNQATTHGHRKQQRQHPRNENYYFSDPLQGRWGVIKHDRNRAKAIETLLCVCLPNACRIEHTSSVPFEPATSNTSNEQNTHTQHGMDKDQTGQTAARRERVCTVVGYIQHSSSRQPEKSKGEHGRQKPRRERKGPPHPSCD